MLRYLYWFPVVVYMGIIYYFSSKTGAQISLPTPDYLAHGVEYYGLSWLFIFAWVGSKAGKLKQGHWLAVLFCFLYGVSDEFHQSFVPGRDASGLDLVADTAGAVLAQLVWFGRNKFRRQA